MDRRTYVIPPISSQGKIVMLERIFNSSIPYNRSPCNLFGGLIAALTLFSSVCQHFELLAGFHVTSVYNRSFANFATSQPTHQAQAAMAALAQA